MKVVKPGRDQKGWAQEYECTGQGNGGGGCGAVLLVERGDLFYTARHYLSEVETFITFRCMSCKVLTDIPRCPVQPLPDSKDPGE